MNELGLRVGVTVNLDKKVRKARTGQYGTYVVLPDGRGLPPEVRARGVHLVQLRLGVCVCLCLCVGPNMRGTDGLCKCIYIHTHARAHLRPVVVVAGHEEGEAEGADAARLRELLHHRGRVPHQLRHGLLLLLCVVRVGIGRGSLMG